MPSSTDIWSILIIVTLAQGLFVITSMLAKKEHQKSSGRWMLLLLLSLFWLQLEFLSIRWPYNVGVTIFYGTRHGSWLLVGPLFYFYLKTLLSQPVAKSAYGLFAPFFIFSVMLPLLLQDFLTYRQVHYGMLTPFDHWPDEIDIVQYVYSSVFIAQFLYLLFFLVKAKILVRKYRMNIKGTSSILPENELRWIHLVWYGMLFTLILACLLISLLFFTEVYRRHMDYLYVIPSSFLIYAFAYKLIGIQLETPSLFPKYEKSGLKEQEIKQYKTDILRAIEQDKLYLQPGLKLKDLSDKLKAPTHHLSEVLNQHMHTSFFDLINRYRVQEAKERIEKHPKYTLLKIAYDSGFNNKTSFVNAFKRFEGTTPSRFMRKSA